MEDEQGEDDVPPTTKSPKPTMLDRLKRLWERAKPAERQEFKRWTKERTKVGTGDANGSAA